jgi:hypothetical protein
LLGNTENWKVGAKPKVSLQGILLASCFVILYTGPHMSPLGIKRTIAVLLILSPWIFIPSLFKDVIFIIAGVFLMISTLDLRKKSIHHPEHQENESVPVIGSTI